MLLTKQAEANRRNAKNSTGPKTDQGKAKASTNALKHGLTARQVVIPGEDPDEYQALLSQLMEEQSPQSALETSLVEQIAGIIWRLKRIPKFEPAIILAYRAFNDQADAVFMHKINEIIMRGSLQKIQSALEEMKAKGELNAEECAMLESLIAHGAGVEAFDTPAAKFGRALVLQGNALEQLGKLPRYERELTTNLERLLNLLEKEQQKRAATIDSHCKEIDPLT